MSEYKPFNPRDFYEFRPDRNDAWKKINYEIEACNIEEDGHCFFEMADYNSPVSGRIIKIWFNIRSGINSWEDEKVYFEPMGEHPDEYTEEEEKVLDSEYVRIKELMKKYNKGN